MYVIDWVTKVHMSMLRIVGTNSLLSIQISQNESMKYHMKYHTLI